MILLRASLVSMPAITRDRIVYPLAACCWLGLLLLSVASTSVSASELPALTMLGSRVTGQPVEGSAAGSEQVTPPTFTSIDSEGLSLSGQFTKARMSLGSWAVADAPVQSNLRSPSAAYVYSQRSQSVVMVFVPDEAFGSGVVVERTGLVLTNWHVVGDRREALVLTKFDDPESLTESDFLVADVISTDPERDLALLLLKRTSASPAPVPMGSLSKVVVGTDVVAIGHPNGLSWTLTEGIVSQIRRNYEWQYEDGSQHRATVIQTQTSINPGSSGGPLFNGAGELVGLNSFSASGESLNFAVASNEIEGFIKSPPRVTQPRQMSEQVEPSVITRVDSSGNGVDDLFGIDADGDRRVDYWWIDADEDGEVDGIGMDLDDDGSIDTIGYDSDSDGQIDKYLIDSNGDGTADTLGVDVNGDGQIDGYRAIK